VALILLCYKMYRAVKEASDENSSVQTESKKIQTYLSILDFPARWLGGI
jgi:hypothetical protein